MDRKLKILYISSAPLTRVSSGYLVARQGRMSPVLEKLSQIYDIRSFGWMKRRELSINQKYVYLLDSFQIFVNLVRHLLKGRFDVIITTGIPVLESIPAFIFAKLLHIPIIIKETHWYWPNTIVSKLIWPINKLMVSKATLVICPGIRAYTYWRLLGVPERKIKIVHFYTSLLQLNSRNIELARALRVKFGGQIVVLYFGRLIRRKGIDYLVRAFEKLRKEIGKTLLVIAGDGPERRNLEKLCNELKLDNVVFTGAVDEEVKPAYFLLADVFVYPSITLELPEEWPLGVVEAMSVGKPVIVTTAVGSAPDVVKQGVNGYVVPEKSNGALYYAIKRLVEDENLRKNMGINAKKTIDESFTYEHAAKGLDEAIKWAFYLMHI